MKNERTERQLIRTALDQITDQNWSPVGYFTGKVPNMHPENNMASGSTRILKVLSYVVPPELMPDLVGSLFAGEEGKNALLNKLNELKTQDLPQTETPSQE